MRDHVADRSDMDSGSTADGAGNPSAPRRDALAGALDTAATKLHAKADGLHGGRIAGMADKTASALDSTATFVREFDSREMLDDVSVLAKKHPGKALAAAALVGFFVGRALTRRGT